MFDFIAKFLSITFFQTPATEVRMYPYKF